MRVTIERGYHPAIQALMGQLQTNDPKLAVQHALGCYFASGGCAGKRSTPSQPLLPADDEFDVIEVDVSS